MLRGLRRHGIDPVVTLYGTPSWANGGRGPNWAPTSGRSFADFAYAAGTALPLDQLLDDLERAEPPDVPPPDDGERRTSRRSSIPRMRSCTPRSAASRSRAASRRLARERAAASRPVAWIRAMASAAREARRLRPPPVPGYGRRARRRGVRSASTARRSRWPTSSDSSVRSHGAFGRKPIWLTEYGYQTNPPDRFLGVSPEQQATYVATAALRVYRSSSVDHADLLHGARRHGRRPGWQSGLLTADGVVKPAYAAFRLPLCRSRVTADRRALGAGAAALREPAVPRSPREGRAARAGSAARAGPTRTGSSRSRSRRRPARASGSGLRATARTGTSSSSASPPGRQALLPRRGPRLGLSDRWPSSRYGTSPCASAASSRSTACRSTSRKARSQA